MDYLKDYERAILDFTRAIELSHNPSHTGAKVMENGTDITEMEYRSDRVLAIDKALAAAQRGDTSASLVLIQENDCRMLEGAKYPGFSSNSVRKICSPYKGKYNRNSAQDVIKRGSPDPGLGVND